MAQDVKDGKQGRQLTVQILLAMAAGVLAGLLLNVLFSGIPGEQGDKAPQALLALQRPVDGLLQILGQVFLSLLQVLVVPLVLVSLTCGTAALNDIRRLGRIGLRTLALYLLTTALAISLALGAAVLVQPGRGFGLETTADFSVSQSPGLIQVVIDVFPKNIFAALGSGNMLQIIVFAIFLGIALMLAGEPGQRILGIFSDLNSVIMKLVWLVMQLAPFGVFALIARTFSQQGFEAFGPLAKYFSLLLALLLVQAFAIYPLLLRLLSNLAAAPFLRKMREVQIFAFSTASSNATLPVTLRTVERQLGVDNSIASFTIPLGATINMDGTAIMQGVATVFIAQAYAMGLGWTDYLLVILTATMASIGTAGIPGVGLILLGMVLTQVGLPVEGIALIIGIDRLLDMVRTAVNVTGDGMVTCVIAKWESALDRKMYEQPDAGLADVQAGQ